ncbi:MAG: nitroreductase family protein [Alphaproteobacteria bacterium]|nr:nitroreductase family protein [Alphaproteobacteria bacterium]
MSIKAKLKKNPAIIYNYRLIKNMPVFVIGYLRDFYRYLIHSRTIAGNSEKERLKAEIIATAHVIEKGFAMQEPRKGFGQDMLKSLIALIAEYEDRKLDSTHNSYVMAVSCLKTYLEFHKNFELGAIKDEIEKSLDKADKYCDTPNSTDSYKSFKKSEIIESAKGDFESLANSRYSVRQLNDEPVDTTIIEEAVSLARKTPSVCNRQCGRVYIIEDKNKIKEVLKYQRGNRGFGHKFDKLLIVASELNVFQGSEERNQSYTDGGMFAMSLAYALHYKGLGACIINWCSSAFDDMKLRKIVNIKPSHEVLLMIGIGNLPEELTVAASLRASLDEVIVK